MVFACGSAPEETWTTQLPMKKCTCVVAFQLFGEFQPNLAKESFLVAWELEKEGWGVGWGGRLA